MILSCNSCEKKFVVPDVAITTAGRTVQCCSCGNKWKQFPLTKKIEKKTDKKISIKKTTNIPKIPKPKKKRINKPREINLYSPEYLQKKHGISINKVDEVKKTSPNAKVSFGFYNSLILFIVIVIVLSRGLYFFENFIVNFFPFSEYYLDYFFESIKNMFEIWKNLISN